MKKINIIKKLSAPFIFAAVIMLCGCTVTILEDIATYGAGIWNDAMSFIAAASSMKPIILAGLKLSLA